MAISVDYSVYPYEINVPKADMLLLQTNPSEIRQLDMNAFRLELKGLEDDEVGMAFPRMTWHNDGVSVGGAVLAKVIVITDDYVVVFEDGQYRVNTVGANTNIGERTKVNQVSVSTSNSAGLQDLNSLQAASFGGEVAVDVSSTYSGTIFPVGTRGFPVNNFEDAQTIAKERGLNAFRVMSSCTLTTNFDAPYVFVADSPVTTTITIDPSAVVADCEFRNVTVQGTLDGSAIFREAVVLDIDYVSGYIYDSALMGTITLGGGAQANIFSCYSGVAGGGPGQYPSVDMNGSEQNSLAVRGYSGGLRIMNNSNPAGAISIDFESGRLVVDPTITDGDVYVRGIADIDDSSGGTAVVYDQTVQADIDTLSTNVQTAADEATLARKLIDADEQLDEDGTWTLRDSDTQAILRQRIVRDKNNGPITLPDGAVARHTKV